MKQRGGRQDTGRTRNICRERRRGEAKKGEEIDQVLDVSTGASMYIGSKEKGVDTIGGKGGEQTSVTCRGACNWEKTVTGMTDSREPGGWTKGHRNGTSLLKTFLQE